MIDVVIKWFPNIGLAIAVYSIVVVAVRLIPQQYAETVGRPYDQFTRLRWRILRMLLLIITALSFPLVYRLVRFFGGDSEFLRAMSNLGSALAVFFFIRTLVYIFSYKYEK